MPKMKTRKAVAAKFKVTGTGKLLRRKPGKRHLLTGKTGKLKRHLGKPALVPDTIVDKYKMMMCV